MGLFRWFGKHLGAVKIVKGTVISKGDENFAAQVSQKETVGKKIVTVGLTIPSAETYTLKVRGVDKDGNELVEDFTVSEFEFNTTNVGDPWPLQGY